MKLTKKNLMWFLKKNKACPESIELLLRLCSHKKSTKHTFNRMRSEVRLLEVLFSLADFD